MAAPMEIQARLALLPSITLLVTIVGVGVAFYQLRELVSSVRSQTYQRIYDAMISIDRFFIDNPDLKSFFYSDSGLTSEGRSIDEPKLASVAEMLVDYFDSVYHQKDCMPTHTFDGFLNYMKGTYRTSLATRKFLASREDWYPADFVKALKA
ncbi:MAG TPA: hypothetical protein VHQ90_14830 [Thermoanaerobaculia bacterium]|nr:hypothetical protein [Thermoanaerobaculia bacterium]